MQNLSTDRAEQHAKDKRVGFWRAPLPWLECATGTMLILLALGVIRVQFAD